MLKILFSLKLTFLVKILVTFAKKWHQLLVSVFLWYASQPEMRVSLLQLQEITISRAARCKFFPLSFAGSPESSRLYKQIVFHHLYIQIVVQVHIETNGALRSVEGIVDRLLFSSELFCNHGIALSFRPFFEYPQRIGRKDSLQDRLAFPCIVQNDELISGLRLALVLDAIREGLLFVVFI